MKTQTCKAQHYNGYDIVDQPDGSITVENINRSSDRVIGDIAASLVARGFGAEGDMRQGVASVLSGEGGAFGGGFFWDGAMDDFDGFVVTRSVDANKPQVIRLLMSKHHMNHDDAVLCANDWIDAAQNAGYYTICSIASFCAGMWDIAPDYGYYQYAESWRAAML